MKKTVCILLLAVMAMCFTVGCTKEKELNDTPLSQAVDKINAEVFGGSDGMRSIDSLDKLELYYSIDQTDVKEFAAEVSKSSATEIDEVVLVKAVDEAAAKRIAEKLEIRLEAQKDLCASYSAELLSVAEKCSVRTEGVLVSLIVCDRYDDALSICDEVLFD